MTEEEHNILIENNIMLREIIKYIKLKESKADKENQEDFIRNIVANIISNGV